MVAMPSGIYFKMNNTTYIFYNSVTGKIYSKRILSEQHAHANCKNNSHFNLVCGLESELGYVFNQEKFYVDVSVDPHVVKKLPTVAPDYAEIHRQERNTKLNATDWRVGVDSPLSDSKKAEWVTYRQALRDITFQQYMTWPKPPQ
jgi:hypothetical protein